MVVWAIKDDNRTSICSINRGVDLDLAATLLVNKSPLDDFSILNVSICYDHQLFKNFSDRESDAYDRPASPWHHYGMGQHKHISSSQLKTPAEVNQSRHYHLFEIA